MEYIHGFEQRQSLLRDSCTTEAVIKGNQATFLVADSNSATAVTRGVNGNIPARADNNTQLTATLEEKHDLVRKTGFNIFESQGDQRRIMQETSMGTINRDIDDEILVQLDTATTTWGAAAAATLTKVSTAITKLGNNQVPFDGNIWAVISPAFLGYLMALEEFASADYITRKPFETGVEYTDQPGFYQWYNVKWIVHPRVSGVGTAAEKCFMYHKNAIGHAVNTQGIDAVIGYDEEQDYSFARCSLFKGSKLLQNSGVIEMTHDGSALS